jgi:hypothetical protein
MTVEYTYYECGDCGFNSILGGDRRSDRDPYPLCEGDTGRGGIMSTREAVDIDVVEGRDARKDLI